MSLLLEYVFQLYGAKFSQIWSTQAFKLNAKGKNYFDRKNLSQFKIAADDK